MFTDFRPQRPRVGVFHSAVVGKLAPKRTIDGYKDASTLMAELFI